MPMQKFIRIGARILNLDAIRYLQIEGDNLVNVYLAEGQELQYIEAEAQALLAALESGYMKTIHIADGAIPVSQIENT
jgi:hypothetical protein